VNWHRVKPAVLAADEGDWTITREILFPETLADKQYFLWHGGEIVAEHLDYQALMATAERANEPR